MSAETYYAMKFIHRILLILLKSLAAISIIALMVVVGTSVSFIYDFAKPQPFSGPNIFNPYRNIDTAHCWKKANFHTHTRVKGIMNECKYWPGDVHKAYERLDYDIITFSNHNELTKHPFDSTLQVNLYEHGYNFFKFHKLVFGCSKVNHFDHLLPLLASQRQFQIDMLSKESDIIQFNHPLHTLLTTDRLLEKVGGYDIMELDCEDCTENIFWDKALSAGRYSFGLANDDLHRPHKSFAIARRCNFICSPSDRYEEIRNTLLDGCYYSMRLPDYGNGNWEEKIKRNKELPLVTEIGVREDTIFIGLSQTADSIKVFGQNHTTLLNVTNSSFAEYKMKENDPYARFTVFFPTGEVLFSNPFARYDAKQADSPVNTHTHSVNIILTILFNTMLLTLLALLAYTLYKIIRKR